MSDDIIDLTLDDEDDDDSDDDDHEGRRRNNCNANNNNNTATTVLHASIPYAAYLPIGVDVTDDIVHIDSDSDNEIHVADADWQALVRHKATLQQQQQQQQGKFDHAAAAARKKRKRAAQSAKQKQKQREEAQRQREEEARQRQQEAERRRLAEETRRLQEKQAMEAKRKAEARALRENPPTNVNFILIDCDPEEDYFFANKTTTTHEDEARKPPPSPPPPAEALRKRKHNEDGSNGTRKRFYPRKPAKSQKGPSMPKPVGTEAAASGRDRSSSSSSSASSQSTTEATATTSLPHNRERQPQPYHGKGARRVEFVRPFQTGRDFNFFRSRQDATAEQDRLLREAAERMRQKQRQHPGAAPYHSATPANAVDSSLFGPTFAQVIPNIHERFPLHWMWKNPFACLGLPPHAPLAAAKAQYRTLVRCYHPDKSRTTGTSSKFHAVVRAFQTIRARYEGTNVDAP